MVETDIVDRIKKLCADRSWSYYRLAKESNMTYSTLNTLLTKNNVPSVATLIKICDGLKITLAQFFDDDEICALMTEEDKEHLQSWKLLTSANKDAANKYTEFLLSQQKDNC